MALRPKITVVGIELQPSYTTMRLLNPPSSNFPCHINSPSSSLRCLINKKAWWTFYRAKFQLSWAAWFALQPVPISVFQSNCPHPILLLPLSYLLDFYQHMLKPLRNHQVHPKFLLPSKHAIQNNIDKRFIAEVLFPNTIYLQLITNADPPRYKIFLFHMLACAQSI